MYNKVALDITQRLHLDAHKNKLEKVHFNSLYKTSLPALGAKIIYSTAITQTEILPRPLQL